MKNTIPISESNAIKVESPDTLTLTKTELLDLMYKARSVPHTLEQILFDYLEDIEGQKI